MKSEHLVWTKHPTSGWHRLADVDPATLSGHGVYVVWHGGFPSRIVCVGSGNIRDELAALNVHPEVPLYAETGPLFVTWADAGPSSAPGIARYLTEKLRPLIEDDVSAAAPIAVESPF